MLDNAGFDLWADGYDKSVGLSEEAERYPFAGYKAVLGAIYRTIKAENGQKVLDVGVGTGVLAKRLYDSGCTVYGVDFSQRMLELAGEKMPGAMLICHDFTGGLPEELRDERFDFIVCTYAIHHLDDAGKVVFLRELLAHTTPGGAVLIGDVAFESRVELEACRAESGAEWDEEEFYPVAGELRRSFPELEFTPITSCSGVLSFRA